MKYIKKYDNTSYEDKLNQDLLKYSKRKASYAFIKSLLEKGANPNCVTNITKNTPLQFAISYGLYNTCKILIKYGADVNLCNSSGDSPLQTFLSNWSVRLENKLNIIDLLIDANVDLNVKHSKFGHTPLDSSIKLRKYIKEKYPEKYKEWELKKEMDKFNV